MNIVKQTVRNNHGKLILTVIYNEFIYNLKSKKKENNCFQKTPKPQ